MSARPLRIFLCHSSLDKTFARELWRELRAVGFEPWLDEKELLPGQEWEPEIERAVRDSDCFLACLSSRSVDRASYLHKEIRVALDVADRQPEGAIFVIPVKLDECELPQRLTKWQWVDWRDEGAQQRLIRALDARATDVGAATSNGDASPRRVRLDDSSSLEGDYIVTGINPDGGLYEGRTTIRRHSSDASPGGRAGTKTPQRGYEYSITQRIDNDVVELEGLVVDGELTAMGPGFSANYWAEPNGSLHGMWTDGGRETLIPSGPRHPPAAGPDVHHHPTASDLAHDKPDGWEYLLLAAVVTDGIQRHEQSRRDYDLGLIAPSGVPLAKTEAVAALNTEVTALSRIFGNIDPLINTHLATALGEPGEPGDPDGIIRAAEGLVSMYASVLEWARRVRSYNLPTELEEAASLIARLADQPLRDTERWAAKLSRLPTEMPALLKRARDSDEGVELELPLVLTADEELAKRVRRALN